MTYRTEHDSMGEVRVPADRYWGAQTERSRNNFPIGAGHENMPGEIIRAFAVLKMAAALANRELKPEKMTAKKCGAKNVVIKLGSKGCFFKNRELSLSLPSLRSRPDEIPSLAVLYLSSLAPSLPQPVAGFDPGALDLLIRYDWPANYTQFKHVLEALASEAQTAYISYAACYEALRRERRLYRRNPESEGGVPYRGRTLADIEGDVFQRVLSDCGGNRTEAARILGVSRTTLWRALSMRSEEEA